MTAKRNNTPGELTPTSPPSRSTPAAARAAFLDKVRAGGAATPSLSTATPAAVGGVRRPRLVFGMDATGSREATWASAKRITDRMFEVIPGALDIALAVHGGNRLHTFSAFGSEVEIFRAMASRVRCESGETRLCELMRCTLGAGGVRVMSYIGDAFEEDEGEALALADRMRLRGIKVIMLADHADPETLRVFEEIANRTGGALLDFRGSQSRLMGEVLKGVAQLAIGGQAMLAGGTSAGARLLLSHLKKTEG
ncbi:hypothetical protein NU688_33240 [Variovorax sp. ZS18.2.2]|uniref:hypothetical protein n=1 Tax=Variovorax sp. ZS18.2.2 TaxID=2971255 RepID=UPI002150E8D0|nr:hypothetical protein [Variovorax sp. ZS18.2.2]MCR6481064.1 hypothetical protein [Variovorax sp. ZS18.2.2]